MNGKLIIILDFEKIIADINPETSLRIDDIGGKTRKQKDRVSMSIVRA